LGACWLGEFESFDEHVGQLAVAAKNRGHVVLTLDARGGARNRTLDRLSDSYADTLDAAKALIRRVLEEMSARQGLLKEAAVNVWSDLSEDARDEHQVAPTTIFALGSATAYLNAGGIFPLIRAQGVRLGVHLLGCSTPEAAIHCFGVDLVVPNIEEPTRSPSQLEVEELSH
jgi:hypothetical protein